MVKGGEGEEFGWRDDSSRMSGTEGEQQVVHHGLQGLNVGVVTRRQGVPSTAPCAAAWLHDRVHPALGADDLEADGTLSCRRATAQCIHAYLR
jgi:hypothetical protein